MTKEIDGQKHKERLVLEAFIGLALFLKDAGILDEFETGTLRVALKDDGAWRAFKQQAGGLPHIILGRYSAAVCGDRAIGDTSMTLGRSKRGRTAEERVRVKGGEAPPVCPIWEKKKWDWEPSGMQERRRAIFSW